LIRMSQKCRDLERREKRMIGKKIIPDRENI